MLRPRINITAVQQSRRSLLLERGARRFYVRPLDVGPRSSLGAVPRLTISDCVSAAHLWLQSRLYVAEWWFRIVERAELGGMSCDVRKQDILVYSDTLFPGFEVEGGAHSTGPRVARGPSGASGAPPGTGTFFARCDGLPCLRRDVPKGGVL